MKLKIEKDKMNNYAKVFAVTALTFGATAASAECTEESMQAKTMEISTGMQALAATDPQKMMEISTELQTAIAAAAESDDTEAACTALDAMIEKMNG